MSRSLRKRAGTVDYGRKGRRGAMDRVDDRRDRRSGGRSRFRRHNAPKTPLLVDSATNALQGAWLIPRRETIGLVDRAAFALQNE